MKQGRKCWKHRFIDTKVKFKEGDDVWRLTCVYGEPTVENRHMMWDKLQNLKAKSDLPWIVVGEYNEAPWGFEHFSATPRSEPQISLFRDCLVNCGLIDLGFTGVPYVTTPS